MDASYQELNQADEKSTTETSKKSKIKDLTLFERMKRHKEHTINSIDKLQPELGNLALFGLERSDGDLSWNWWNVGEIISECNDPARPPMKGCNRKFLHWKLRRIVENIYFRVFTFLLIITDISIVITEISINCSWNPVSIVLRNLDVAISVYFVIEVLARIFALTPKVFFSKKSWHNIVDFIVVMLAFAATIAAVVIIDNIEEDEKEYRDGNTKWKCETEEGSSGKQFSLLVVIRIIRILRFIRLIRIYFEHRRLVKGIRQRISENKRRFQVDGYDLDLTYILTNVIAMSFPSKGTKALYRNKIDNVAKFFEDKYSDREHIDYMIYNLCSEMEYDHRKFHGNVRRYRIDDHNVPTIEQMFELTEDVREWLSGSNERERERVVALHCKGGKGRTGTMICAILIDMGLFKDASESLQYFGQRRTDLNVSQQFQGVETYSQIRYVHYFQTLKSQNLRNLPSKPLRVLEFKITGLREVGAGDGSDFSVSIFTQGNQIFSSKFSDSSQCKRKYDVKRDLVSVSIQKQVVINQDTKFMFHCSTSGVPVGYDDCAFFFWLHTYFIENNRILLSREQLDNPHKQKTWAVWRENFFVEVSFGKP